MLRAAIKSQSPVLVTGHPGVGKTDTGKQAFALEGFDDVIVTMPAVEDPTVPAGIPWMGSGDSFARLIPFEQLHRLQTATKPTGWIIDDLGQGSGAVQAAYMQWLLARQCGAHRLSDQVSIVAMTNHLGRGALHKILEPVRGRFVTVIEQDVDAGDWVDWALGGGTDRNGVPIDCRTIAYIRQYPDQLQESDAPPPGMKGFRSPRGWAAVTSVHAMGLPRNVEAECLSGTIGDGAGTQYAAWLNQLASMLSIDDILLDPRNAALPVGPSQCYATVTALAAKTTIPLVGRAAIYIERLAGAGLAEFAALGIKDTKRRLGGALEATPEYLRLMNGEIGRMLFPNLEEANA